MSIVDNIQIIENEENIRKSEYYYILDILDELSEILLDAKHSLYAEILKYISDFEPPSYRKSISFIYSFHNVALICAICLRYSDLFSYFSEYRLERIKKIIKFINEKSVYGTQRRFEIIEDSDIIFQSLNNVEILEAASHLPILNRAITKWHNINSTYEDKMGILKDIERSIFNKTVKPNLYKLLPKGLLDSFFQFTNDCKIKNSNHAGDNGAITRYATEEELQIMFDFGLTLIRFAKANNLI